MVKKYTTLRDTVKDVVDQCKEYSMYQKQPARMKLIVDMFVYASTLKKDNIDSYIKQLKKAGLLFDATKTKSQLIKQINWVKKVEDDERRYKKKQKKAFEKLLKLDVGKRLGFAVQEWLDEREGLPATKTSVEKVARKYKVSVKKLADIVLYDESNL